MLFEQAKTEIAERKQAEAELTRYKNHLEDEIKQRTADLVLASEVAVVARCTAMSVL